MITAIVIDDDIHFAQRLQKELTRIARCRNMDMRITITEDPRSCMDSLCLYDIYFIDMVMPDQMGLDLARALREQHINSEIIFVSAYVRYMREAFYVTPRAYIHKEHLEEELEEAFSELERIFRHRKTKISIKNNKGDVAVRPGDIMYLKSEAHYVEIHEAGKEVTSVRNTLGKLEEQMKEYDFLRIHLRYLINLNYVQEYNKYSVKMKNGEELLISAPYRKRVLAFMVNRATAAKD